MSAINFTSKLIDTTTIKKRNFFLYKEQNAYIVELDPSNKKDLSALHKTALNWKHHKGKYAIDIYYRANSNIERPQIKTHYYALTTQNQNFEKLIPNNILGLMLFNEKNNANNSIGLLEVNPTTNKSNNTFRKYKQVGKKFIDFLKTNFPNKSIEVWSDYTARDFYKKQGFKKPLSFTCDFIWNPIKQMRGK